MLTSSGIANPNIQDALVNLLSKPISKLSALFVPTGKYPLSGGGGKVLEAKQRISHSET
jgi:dipeptidase E